MHHKLRTIAEAKYWYAKFKQFLSISRCSILIARVWSTSQNNACRIHLFNFFKWGTIRIDFTVDITFSDATSYKLIVLSAKIDNNDFLLVHRYSLFVCYKFS